MVKKFKLSYPNTTLKELLISRMPTYRTMVKPVEELKKSKTAQGVSLLISKFSISLRRGKKRVLKSAKPSSFIKATGFNGEGVETKGVQGRVNEGYSKCHVC